MKITINKKTTECFNTPQYLQAGAMSACGLHRSVYEGNGGIDGRIKIEVRDIVEYFEAPATRESLPCDNDGSTMTFVSREKVYLAASRDHSNGEIMTLTLGDVHVNYVYKDRWAVQSACKLSANPTLCENAFFEGYENRLINGMSVYHDGFEQRSLLRNALRDSLELNTLDAMQETLELFKILKARRARELANKKTI